MQPPDLAIGLKEPRRLERARHFRQRGDIAARKDVFRDPGAGGAGRGRAPDSVDQGHAILGQPVAHGVEIGPVMRHADMFEHADRDDAVELPGHVAVIAQLEFHFVRQPLGLGALGGPGMLFGREGDAQNLRSVIAREAERQPAPPAADLEHAHSGLQQQFPGDMRLLGSLRFLQAHLGLPEIGAGILPVFVEEEIVERRRQVIMMRHVLPRAMGRVPLVEAASCPPRGLRRPAPPQMTRTFHVHGQEGQKPAQVVIAYGQAAIHIALAQGHIGGQHQLAGQVGVVKPQRHRRAVGARIGPGRAIRELHVNAAHAHEAAHNVIEEALPHRPHSLGNSRHIPSLTRPRLPFRAANSSPWRPGAHNRTFRADDAA